MRTAQDTHGRSVALMKFLSAVSRRLGVAEHVYVVGGAVRNWILGQPIKDIDCVFDSLGAGAGRDSAWFAKAVKDAIPAITNLTTNQYGVAILSISESWMLDGHEMQSETIEIANARKESYGGAEGKGYKPHMVEPATIDEDLLRREFTFNTLLWRMLDLADGPDKAEILDLTGTGKQHLDERTLRTPVNPDKTFSDDPTRMLRAIKFVAKYGFRIPPDVAQSIRRNAPSLTKMPWDAIRKIVVDDILEGPAPRRSVELMQSLGLSAVLKEMLHEEPGFAAALGRSLNEHDAHLLLDLLDQGWVVRTPISFLDRAGQLRLREILLENASSPDFDRRFVEALKKPSLDQQRLFAQYAIPPKDRQAVVQIARKALLADPHLVARPHDLLAQVEEELYRRYPSPTTVRVASRFFATMVGIDTPNDNK